ncbi:MAG: hypothetical protein ACXV8Q_03515 [Methylobacter sp.]
MARLRHIRFEPHIVEVIDGKVLYMPSKSGRVINGLPQIFFSDGMPWQEANLWAMERATARDVSIKTIQANMVALHHYCNWLERENVDWLEFPVRKQDRCIVRYRGELVDAREEGLLAPSTVTERMNSVIRFYRWILETGLFSSGSPLWVDRLVKIRYFDKVGFERSLLRTTTDVSIPNRCRPGERLEDGLLPVSLEDRDRILTLARDNASQELFLMLSLGFFTGMRLGTITDIKIQTLERAVPDPASSDLFRLGVGPGASPNVHTKFGVTGHIWVTRQLLEELKTYAYSVRRLEREAKAMSEHKNLLFLTRFGNPYGHRGSDRSSAVNVEMFNFRKFWMESGIAVLRHFHFHQSRCTYGTELTRIGIRVTDPINTIELVRNAMLHKSEATTFKYIKFVQKEPVKEEMANAFTQTFLGLLEGKRTTTNA